MTTSELRRAGAFARSLFGTEPLRPTTDVGSISGYRTPSFPGKCLAVDRASGMTSQCTCRPRVADLGNLATRLPVRLMPHSVFEHLAKMQYNTLLFVNHIVNQ